MPDSNVQHHRIWLLSLVFRFRFGGWLTGGIIFCIMYGLFRYYTDPAEVGVYTTIFLSGMVAYIVPIYAYIVERSEQAFDALEHLLEADASQRRQWKSSLAHQSASWTAVVAGAGIALGFGHVMILGIARGGSIGEAFNDGSSFMSSLATLCVWLTMTTVTTSVTQNAFLFYRLGRDHLRIDLLTARELVPLAWVSVISTLAFIGAQAMFTLLTLDANSGWETVVPGFLGTAPPMIPMFLLPIWSTHRRLKIAKHEELEAVREQLELLRAGQAAPLAELEKLSHLNELLAYRREINGVSEWPFDLGAMSRLGLYLIIPPLTWVGAALIENLVDTLL
jgi:hypothetical protein